MEILRGTAAEVCLWILGGINVFAFLLYALDKYRAKRRARRIPEKSLLLVAACFGALGALAGMLICRHKTRKRRFRWMVPSCFVLQLAIIAFLLFYPAIF